MSDVSVGAPEAAASTERIDLKVGFACNNRCHFCVQGDKRSRFAPRPTEELRDVLRTERRRVRSVVFTGGEPTMRRDLPELVAYARELGYTTIQIQTNGRMFAHAGYARRLVECGATEFSPALHGHRPELHDHLTEAPGAFAQTVAGIRNLKALGQLVLTNTVVTRSNYRHLPEIVRLLVSLGVDQLQLAFVHPVGTAGAEFQAVVPRMELAAPYLAAALRLALDAGRRVYTEAVPPCVIPGYERCVVETLIPRTAIYDAESTIADYTQYRLAEGKLKGPECPTCLHFAECEGPWREYPERYGWSEFRPVTAAPAARAGDPA
ncbi:MAG TPA: radical SAM protein [Anaeromyxobacter sp.]|nr:radical SAM protein [Anaeromyxobacter sp.]